MTRESSLSIRCSKEKANLLNNARNKGCVARYDAGVYTFIQIFDKNFLCAASHLVGVHTDALQPRDDASSDRDEEQATNASTSDASPSTVVNMELWSLVVANCDVCLIAPREG